MRWAIIATALLFGVSGWAEEQDPHAQAMTVDREFAETRATLSDDVAEKVLARLASRLSAPESVAVRLLRHPGANAFALPNGSIYLQTGLMLRVSSETELAGLLAHELAHLTLGHFDTSLGPARSKGGSDLIADEMAADALAIETLVEAGYCPADAATFFERLLVERETQPRDLDRTHSHPALGDRVSAWQRVDCANVPREKRSMSSFDVFRLARFDALTLLLRQRRIETLMYLSRQDYLRADLGVDGEYFWAESFRLRDATGDRERSVAGFSAALASHRYADIARLRLAELAMLDRRWQRAQDYLNSIDVSSLPQRVAGYHGPMLDRIGVKLSLSETQ